MKAHHHFNDPEWDGEPGGPVKRSKIKIKLADGKERAIQHGTQTIIDAEKSDLFDVLAHVAYAIPTLTREERATRAKVDISTRFNPKQRAFLDFVLFQCIRTGVEELSQEKLPPLLRLK